MNTSRRGLLCRSVATAATAFFGVAGRAVASMEDVEKLIAEFGEGATGEEAGPLQLSIPDIAENGNSVPVSFAVDSPMTDDDYVMSVMIIASENPEPVVATFHFTPASGLAKVSTRMRLARTQDVVAVARTSSGKLFKVSKNVKVTIGGCGS